MKRMNKVMNIILLIAMAIVMQGSNYIATRKHICKTVTYCAVCLHEPCPCFKVKLCLPVRR